MLQCYHVRMLQLKHYGELICLESSADQSPVKADADLLARLMRILELFLAYLFPLKM